MIYLVTPSSANDCEGDPFTVTVTVNPTAQVNEVASQVLCNNESTDAINFSTENSGGTTTYTWTNNNTAINLAASGTGNIPSLLQPLGPLLKRLQLLLHQHLLMMVFRVKDLLRLLQL